MGGVLNVDVWIGTFGIKRVVSLKDPETVPELKEFGRNFTKFEKGTEVPEFDSKNIFGVKVY